MQVGHDWDLEAKNQISSTGGAGEVYRPYAAKWVFNPGVIIIILTVLLIEAPCLGALFMVTAAVSAAARLM